MRQRISAVGYAVRAALGGAALLAGAPALAQTSCADLASLALPDTQITAAERVTSGTFNVPGSNQALDVPAICRVAGVVEPAIRFEVWLPEGDAWNGRFQAVGGGGLAGIISYPAMAEAVRAGLCVRVHGHGPRSQ
jgi:feruloyl esterase